MSPIVCIPASSISPFLLLMNWQIGIGMTRATGSDSSICMRRRMVLTHAYHKTGIPFHTNSFLITRYATPSSDLRCSPLSLALSLSLSLSFPLSPLIIKRRVGVLVSSMLLRQYLCRSNTRVPGYRDREGRIQIISS